MPFLFDDLANRKPYLYHLTSAQNLERIRDTRTLESAAELMRRAGRLDLLRFRRRQSVQIFVDGKAIMLRDQAPLHQGHIAFDDGWDIGRLIESINSRVFFWPGDSNSPIAYGRRHFGRYAEEKPVILRVGLREVVAANLPIPPMYCPYNSGSPRTVAGKKSPRGPSTFLPCDAFPRSHQGVVEVTFEGHISLPHMEALDQAGVDSWAPL
jgi:hypothetical protein